MNLISWGLVRREPYRLFFPLAAVLGILGVGHWLAYVLGWTASYTAQGHAFVQIEAFLTCFACGFLMTMIPRRTMTGSASSLEIVAAVVALGIVTAASLAEKWIVAEAAFIGVLLLLVTFALRRFRNSRAAPIPDAFVLIPLGLGQGALGALLVLLAAARVVSAWWISPGRGLVQEGMFLCLALGIGHMLVPVLTGTRPARERGMPGRMLHAVIGLVILASFFVQAVVGARLGLAVGTRVGTGLRAIVLLADLGACLGAWRRPITPGFHRRLAWISFWMLPLGETLAAIMPAHRAGLLHVTFIGGFTLMSLAVATHVVGSHAGRPEMLLGRPWPIVVQAILVGLALLARVAAEFLSSRGYWSHLGSAAFTWILALMTWLAWIGPKVLAPEAPGEGGAAHPLPIAVALPPTECD